MLGCTSCSGTTTSLTCTACDNIAFIFDIISGNCICGPLYYKNGTTCSLCSSNITNCASCTASGNPIIVVCASCSNSYTLNLGSCIACGQTGCITCSTPISSTSCLTCDTSLGYNLAASSGTCTVANGYFLSSVTNLPVSCNTVDPYCNLCTSTSCSSCSDPYYYDSFSASCLLCSSTITNCFSCQNTLLVCTSCSSGFFLNTNNPPTCDPCSTGCLVCVDNSNCTTCDTLNNFKLDLSNPLCICKNNNYFLNNGQSVLCNVNISNCL